MPLPPDGPGRLARHRAMLRTPALWPGWPVLPVVRVAPDPEFGVLVDLFHAVGLPGYGATVFRCNLFELPGRVGDLLALPREVYDTADEVLAAGWRVD